MCPRRERSASNRNLRLTMKSYLAKTENLKLKTTGFGVLEIVIAITIISSALFAITTVARTSLELNRREILSTRAGFLLEEGSEGIRMMRDSNWSNISGLPSGVPFRLVFEGGSWLSTTSKTMIDGIFDRAVVVDLVYRDGADRISSSGILDADTKKFTVEISWWNSLATTTRDLVFYLSNIN